MSKLYIDTTRGLSMAVLIIARVLVNKHQIIFVLSLLERRPSKQCPFVAFVFVTVLQFWIMKTLPKSAILHT